MKKSELKVLESLLQNEDVKAKKSLERFIWANTSAPAFNEGDVVCVYAPRNYVYGNKMDNYVGRVTKIITNVREMCYTCQVTMEFLVDDTEYKSVDLCVLESAMKKCRKYDINKISKKSKYAEEISL